MKPPLPIKIKNDTIQLDDRRQNNTRNSKVIITNYEHSQT